MLSDNISVSPSGHLLFAGQDTVELARRYGTPLYLMDEDRIRRNCRMYKEAFAACFGPGSVPLYAGKAASFKQIYRIMAQEDMGIDVASMGEIATAAAAGYDLSRACFHSNNKTDADIACAMDHGVGLLAADNVEEIHAIEAEAARRGVTQRILLRLTPGIDPHTYAAINTGKVDSKFGSAIETGQAEAITVLALRQPHLELAGFHCHVGSQLFEEDVYERSARIMLGFCAEMKRKYGYFPQLLDLGGGYGVRYVESDPQVDIPAGIARLAAVVKDTCAALDIPVPAVGMEPGRSIVADAGMTLYTCGSVKRIPGYKNYVAVDGGMPDNIRFALYGARYTCLAAGRMQEACDMTATLAGRCCESGDILQENVPFPAGLARGDIIAVCTTGAYHYSMASNYNRLGRPPVVMLRNGDSYVAVRRETPEDLCRNDV